MLIDCINKVDSIQANLNFWLKQNFLNCPFFLVFSRMDINNPWQVESIEAFYVLKCPECAFYTKQDNQFYIHAIENHPMCYELFGKPKVKNEIPDYQVKIEPPENSFEVEDTQTLPEESNKQIESERSESYEPFSCKFCVKSFSDLNDMKMHLKVHEKAALDLTNIFETESFKNLTTLNQGGITYANKPENIQSFIETGYGMPENSFEVKSESNKLDSLAKQEKCFHCGRKRHAKGQKCPNKSVENSTTTNDKMNNITRSQKRDNKTVEKSENNKTKKKTEKKMCEKKQENKTEKKCGKKRKKKNRKKADKNKEFVCPKKKCGKLFENR